MRIWDVDPACLCRKHLTGEHRELHGLWNILTQGKRGYARHPETLRWRDRLAALYARHEQLAAEMGRRGYNHATPLDQRLATGSALQDRYVDKPDQQRRMLRDKPCECLLKPGSPRNTSAPAPRRTLRATPALTNQQGAPSAGSRVAG